MKTFRILVSVLAAIALVGMASCSSCGDPEGDNNNAADNNDNANNDNNARQCVTAEDCDPGQQCVDGACSGSSANNGNNCSDPCDCEPTCSKNGVGDGDNPFDLDEDDETAQGVVLDEDGNVTLDVKRVESHFIWISNTQEGQISKVDTRTFEVVGKYWSGPDDTSNDPSRTSVNTYGDVFVGNRRGHSVTKFSSLGEDCRDSNGDGMVTTSSGPDVVLPWGEDDCMWWNTRLEDGGWIRAVAAQDVRPNDDTAKPGVWVGGWDGVTWKLDGDRGTIDIETQSPVQNYGFALDGLGNLWISGWSNQAIGRIDTNKCTDNNKCNVEVCTGEGAPHDDCVKQRISLPHQPYGITVDFKQRIWVGGQQTARYDPSQAPGSRLTVVSDVDFVHGIAADEEGWIWGSGYSQGVYRYEADNPTNHIAVPNTQFNSKGMAVDLDGKIWSINYQDSTATVIEPGAGINDNNVTPTAVDQLGTPYTYSDMTGAQLRFATDERGFYRRVFEGCPDTGRFLDTVWRELRFQADTPDPSSITFRARAADSVADLAAADWVDVGETPPATSPLDLETALKDAGLQGKRFVEIEAQLNAVREPNRDDLAAPTLMSMEVTHLCPPSIQ